MEVNKDLNLYLNKIKNEGKSHLVEMFRSCLQIKSPRIAQTNNFALNLELKIFNLLNGLHL